MRFETVTEEALAEWKRSPFRFRGESEAALKSFLASDARYAIARMASQSMRQVVQRVAGTAKTVDNGLGKKGKKLHKTVYSAQGFAEACSTLALEFENLTQGDGDGAVRAIGITKTS